MWESIDSSLKDDLLTSITSTLECSVCADIMAVPVISSCGHSFCYECCNSWFQNKVSCPTCRKELENAPVLNVQLKDIIHKILDIQMTLSSISTEERLRIKERLDQSSAVYSQDLRDGKLYGQAFKSVLTLVDVSDGVPRCANCHWEAHGSLCSHCGAIFRTPREDDDYDSAGAYDEDDQEGNRSEEDRYDSNDSFVDDGSVVEVNDDDSFNYGSSRESHQDYSDNGISRGPYIEMDVEEDLQSVDGESWRGFRTPTEVLLDSDMDNEENRSNRNSEDPEDLSRAIDLFHRGIEDLDSDHSDTEAVRSRRRNVIDLSDSDDNM